MSYRAIEGSWGQDVHAPPSLHLQLQQHLSSSFSPLGPRTAIGFWGHVVTFE